MRLRLRRWQEADPSVSRHQSSRSGFVQVGLRLLPSEQRRLKWRERPGRANLNCISPGRETLSAHGAGARATTHLWTVRRGLGPTQMGTEAGRTRRHARRETRDRRRGPKAGSSAASSLDQLRGVRTAPQYAKTETGSGIVDKRLDRTTTKRRVPATAPLALPPLHHKIEREGAPTDGSTDCIENTQCAPSA